MPYYDFTNGVETRTIRAPMAAIGDFTRQMEAKVFRRIFTPSALHVYPVTMQEAMEWTEADNARIARENKAKGDDMFREAISQVRRADMDGFLNGEIEI